MIDSPSGGASEKAPRWDLLGTEGCGGGEVFSWLPLMVLGYKSTYIGERIRSGELQGVRPQPLWAPRAPPDLILSPIYSHISPNQQRHPQKHFSTTATFCTHEIPSRDLFRHPAGGGFDHGGLLHKLYCPSNEA